MDPVTNIFTEWEHPTLFSTNLIVDSEDNVFIFRTNSGNIMNRLDPDTNTITRWLNTPNAVQMSIDFFLDDNLKRFYYSVNAFDKVAIFDYSVDQITTWPMSSSEVDPDAVTADSTGTMFFSEQLPFIFRVARLDTSTNILTEWQIPESAGPIVVDSSGNVFFSSSGGFTRLVPSTNTFTEWNAGGTKNLLKVDSSDVIQFRGGGAVIGFIT